MCNTTALCCAVCAILKICMWDMGPEHCSCSACRAGQVSVRGVQMLAPCMHACSVHAPGECKEMRQAQQCALPSLLPSWHCDHCAQLLTTCAPLIMQACWLFHSRKPRHERCQAAFCIECDSIQCAPDAPCRRVAARPSSLWQRAGFQLPGTSAGLMNQRACKHGIQQSNKRCVTFRAREPPCPTHPCYPKVAESAREVAEVPCRCSKCSTVRTSCHLKVLHVPQKMRLFGKSLRRLLCHPEVANINSTFVALLTSCCVFRPWRP